MKTNPQEQIHRRASKSRAHHHCQEIEREKRGLTLAVYEFFRLSQCSVVVWEAYDTNRGPGPSPAGNNNNSNLLYRCQRPLFPLVIYRPSLTSPPLHPHPAREPRPSSPDIIVASFRNSCSARDGPSLRASRTTAKKGVDRPAGWGGGPLRGGIYLSWDQSFGAAHALAQWARWKTVVCAERD